MLTYFLHFVEFQEFGGSERIRLVASAAPFFKSLVKLVQIGNDRGCAQSFPGFDVDRRVRRANLRPCKSSTERIGRVAQVIWWNPLSKHSSLERRRVPWSSFPRAGNLRDRRPRRQKPCAGSAKREKYALPHSPAGTRFPMEPPFNVKKKSSSPLTTMLSARRDLLPEI